MYDKRYSLALKTGCFLLLLVALVVGVAGGAAACYLADQGAYTISREDMLEMGLQERCGAVADNVARAYAQETYGAAEEDLPGYLFAYAYDGHWQLYPQYYMGQSNYRYEIRDGAGNLLKSTYNGEGCLARLESVQTVSEILVDSPPYGDRLEETESSGIYWKAVDLTYTVTGYVLQDLAYDDQFSQYVSLVGNMYQYRFALVVLVCVCLAALLCLVVYLLSAAGHRPDRQGIALNPFDKLPGDLYLAAVIGGVTLLAMLFRRSFYWEGWITLVTGIACLLAAGILVTAFLMSLATRVKYGQGYWWRRSVIGFCLVLLLRACRFVVRGARSLFGMLPTIWKWLLIGGLAWIFTLACLNPYTTGMGALATACLWAFLIVYPAWSFGQLRKAARRMAEGKFQEKVPLDHLHGSFRQIAQDLNALGQGASLAVERQLRSERMKTELITNVSHDIKTPLTSIVNYVDLLQKPHTPQEGEQYLEVLARQSQRLKKLTEDLVEMSKASSGNIPVNLAPVNVVELVNQALAEYEEKLKKAQLPVVFTARQSEILTMADGRLFWRVLDNLLGNCVKYAQPGTRVYVDVVKYEKKVMISMKNVSRAELNLPAEELMERFVRGDCARNTEGSGLGLNIAKTLMELQKGKLNLVIDGDLFKAVLLFDNLEPGQS
ncbi:MAG TPA: HAMP domain-containing histidine kinase [Candidatus Faecousia gallistercoris]|nr:HAMP domain-containing histidine kinase [Candidatus Faecousia gallistercoris]